MAPTAHKRLARPSSVEAARPSTEEESLAADLDEVPMSPGLEEEIALLGASAALRAGMDAGVVATVYGAAAVAKATRALRTSGETHQVRPKQRSAPAANTSVSGIRRSTIA
jgi:hypothetical protein